uniref:Uncharacterized protein n=1 Tax=Acidianus sp. (strain A1-3) TaxID=1071056 RepID=G0WXM0_ACIS1|nr:conserved hypothetical protein [Acidianus sp. A1-3]
MPTVSIWLNPSTFKLLEDFAESVNSSPSKLIKQMIEDKVKRYYNEEYVRRVEELYKWLYYEGDYLSFDIYAKRILKNKNSEAILSIISTNDELRILLKTLGMLMLVVSCKSYSDIPSEDILMIKNIKYAIIDEIKGIKIYYKPLLYAKILWLKCIDKIRNASLNNQRDWEKYAFACGLQAITFLSEDTLSEIYNKLGLHNIEDKWKELIKYAINIINSSEKIVEKCANCRSEIINGKCSCKHTIKYLSDINL